MPNLTPQQEAYCARLSESSQRYYRLRASRMTDRERFLEAMAWEIMGAVECSDRGEGHPRMTSTVDRTKKRITRMYAEQAAFYPKRPTIIVTAPMATEITYGDYTDRRRGRFGATLQE